MNALTVSVLLACFAVSDAQLGVMSSPLGSGSPTGLLSGNPTSGGGPLTNVPNPATTYTTTNANGGFFRNPLLNYGLMGGENFRRALMLPFLTGLGGSNTANYYYLRGGMDNYFQVMMSDTISRMLARSTGMNPMLTAMLAGQITDAPDNYALSNMLFNGGLFGGNTGGRNAGSSQGQGLGLLPTGAASRFQQGAGGLLSAMNPMNTMAFASMSGV